MIDQAENPLNESYQEIISAWSLYVQARGFKPNTQQSHVFCVREFLEQMDSKFIYHLRDITAEDIWKHYLYLQQRPNKRQSGGLSASMLNFHIYSLRTFFGWLQNLEAVSINPFTALSFDRQFSVPRVALSQQDIQALYRVCESNKDRALLSIYYGLGLRRQEGVDLNVSDIDFALNKVIIRKGKYAKRRELPLHDKIHEMLKEYILTDRREFIIARTPKCPQTMFYNSIGNRTSGNTMNSRIKYLAQKAEITKPVSLHVLRHSVATHLMENSMPMEQVKEYLGHSTLDVTERYVRGYGWAWNKRQRKTQ